MKAVNLIPPDRRGPRKRTFGPGRRATDVRRPTGAYAVLTVLALAVVMAGAWALTSRQLNDRQAQLATTEQAAQAAEASVASLAPYTRFAALSASRSETIRGLVNGRFNWSAGLREIARVIPADVDLISLTGTASPASSVQGGAGDDLRSALPVPAFSLVGCARSQSRVAQLLARLRAIDGVQRVSLSSAEKADGAAKNESDCRSTDQMPEFSLTVFFQAPSGIVPAAGATPTGSTVPASTSTGGAG